MPYQNSGSQSPTGTLGPRRGGREGVSARSTALDGGDELRGLKINGDVPAEQNPADDLARVPGRVLRIGIHVSAPC